MITATEALQQLKEGNQRFVNGGRVVKDLTNRERRTEVMKGHEPFAIVLGHSNCGAIEATVEQLETPNEIHSPNLASIVDRIRPSVEPLFANKSDRDHDELLHDAMLANVRASVDQLRHGSAILENLVQNHDLQIVGAEYSIETGQVDFLKNAPETN
jgi:carbonic anhydrase